MSELIYLGRVGGAKTLSAFGRHFALKALVLLMALLLLPMALSTAASSQTPERRYAFNIGPSAMTDGIKGVEALTGIALIYSPDQIEGLRTRGVTGNLTIEEALQRLIEATPLAIRTAGDDTYTVALARAHLADASDRSSSDGRDRANGDQAQADALRARPLGRPARRPAA